MHSTSDLVVLADAVWQQPVDGQDPRLDSTACKSRVQLGLRPVQSFLDLRHFGNNHFIRRQHSSLKLSQLVVAQYHHHRAELLLMLNTRTLTASSLFIQSRTLRMILFAYCLSYLRIDTRSSAVAERPHDAS